MLRPAILWNDQRTGAQCDEIRNRVGKERLIQITGNDALTGFTAPKILWVQEERAGNIRSASRHILLPKDYVRLPADRRLCHGPRRAARGPFCSICNRAIGRLRCWRALEHQTRRGCRRPSRAPRSLASCHREAADATGLQAGTPVVGGGGDQAAGAVGTGAVVEGIVSSEPGHFGGGLRHHGPAIIEPEGRLHAFCHAVPGKWHLMGVMLSAAGSLRWYRDTLCAAEGFRRAIGSSGCHTGGQRRVTFLALPDRRTHASP